eukprot:372634-Rhodomonas_salina.1
MSETDEAMLVSGARGISWVGCSGGCHDCGCLSDCNRSATALFAQYGADLSATDIEHHTPIRHIRYSLSVSYCDRLFNNTGTVLALYATTSVRY